MYRTTPGCNAQSAPQNDTVVIVAGDRRYFGSCVFVRALRSDWTTVVITSYFAPLTGSRIHWDGARAALSIEDARSGLPAKASLQLPDQDAEVTAYAPSAKQAHALLTGVRVVKPT